jgi:hypothetical protein
MNPMESPSVNRPPASESGHTGDSGRDMARETIHIEHVKLPSLGSGPILPLWMGRFFKHITSSH